MELDSFRLQAFFEVAKTKNFSQAAKHLALTQSALSQRIAKLEAELETALFLRSTQGVQLTDAGLSLLRYCQVKRQLEDEFLSHLSAKSTPESLAGTLRIAGYSSVVRSVLLPSLQALLCAHPRIRLEVICRELSDLPGLLTSGEVDFVVLNQRLEQSALETYELGQEELVGIEPVRATSGMEVYLDHDLSDTTSEDYLRLQGKAPSRLQRHFLDDVYGIVEGVELGLGRAVVSRHLVRKNNQVRILSAKRKMLSPVILHFFQRPYYTSLHQAAVRALTANAKRFL